MINVVKANGAAEPFSEEKVINSIYRARIPEGIRHKVLDHVKSKIYEGIPTSEIYRHILEFLGQSEHPYSKSRYSLKESIMMLGPTGYPFEDFIAGILNVLGYKTQVRQILRGKCVSHEVDVVAEKESHKYMIEAKFHNKAGIRSDIQVALYTYARFLDLKDSNSISEGWLVTNTKTTSDADAYAKCQGLKVISWSYPEDNSLRDLIEKSRLQPITMLSSLSTSHKESLLNDHVVMCKDLCQNPEILDSLLLSDPEREKIIREAKFVCDSVDLKNHNS